MSDFEHTIIEKIQLPSRGLPYGDTIPGGWIDMAPMRTKEEKLFSAANADVVKVLQTIVERCLLTKSQPLEKYLLTDYFFMLLVIRNLSYGPEYSFQVRCPACRHNYQYFLEIPEGFETRVLADGVIADEDGNVPEKFSEPFYASLPLCKKKVGLRLLRLEDEEEIENLAARVVQNPDEGDPAFEIRMAKHIVSIDDEEVDIRQAIEFIENLYAMDSSTIRETISESDCGVNLILKPRCTRCGTTGSSRFQFTPDFFRKSRV